jgi:hypothetical protein
MFFKIGKTMIHLFIAILAIPFFLIVIPSIILFSVMKYLVTCDTEKEFKENLKNEIEDLWLWIESIYLDWKIK